MESIQKRDDDRFDTAIGVLVAIAMLIGVGLYAIKPWQRAVTGTPPETALDLPVGPQGLPQGGAVAAEDEAGTGLPMPKASAPSPALVLIPPSPGGVDPATAGAPGPATAPGAASAAALALPAASAGVAPRVAEPAPLAPPALEPQAAVVAPTPVAPPKVVVVREHILFESDSAELPVRFKPRLNEIADLLRSGGRVYTVAGHTDSLGDPPRNLELSLARAESVKAYLVERGVPAERLKTLGMGESDPLSTNATAKGRARNRRIEITE